MYDTADFSAVHAHPKYYCSNQKSQSTSLFYKRGKQLLSHGKSRCRSINAHKMKFLRIESASWVTTRFTKLSSHDQLKVQRRAVTVLSAEYDSLWVANAESPS